METKAFLKVQSISKSFWSPSGTQLVLDQFCCEIVDGTFQIITGPNGIGKSVLAKCLAGLLQFESGRVEIDGRVFTVLDPKRARAIGIEYVPQLMPKPANVTGLEFLSLARPQNEILYSRRKIERAAKDVIEAHSLVFNLGMLRSPLAELSLTDLRRLYIVRALMTGARLLILDEPTAGLPEQEAQKLLDTLATLASQSMPAAMSLATNVLSEDVRGAASAVPLKKKPLSVLVIAHPVHLKTMAYDVRRLTPSRLVSSNSAALIPEIERASRIPVNHGYWSPYTLEIERMPSLNLRSGKVIAITGESSREFFNYFEAVSDALAAIPELIVREIPFEAIETRLAPNVALDENCLVNRWWSQKSWAALIDQIAFDWVREWMPKLGSAQGWRKLLHFISREKVRAMLVEPIVATLRIEPRRVDLLAGEFSGGNRQLLIIGRALWGNLDVLIAGDIFRGLDEAHVRHVAKLLVRKATEGTCVLMFSVTPRFEEVLSDEAHRFENELLWTTRPA